jgi:hypothetical protein
MPASRRSYIEPEVQDYILFGAKVCSACGRKLPKCGDWFSPAKDSSDGLTSHCRECKNEADRRRT